jgi:hypothetical protein
MLATGGIQSAEACSGDDDTRAHIIHVFHDLRHSSILHSAAPRVPLSLAWATSSQHVVAL